MRKADSICAILPATRWPGHHGAPVRFGRCAACLLAGLLAIPSAPAAVIAYDGFDYPAAENGLNSASGGEGWANSWSAVDNDTRASGLGYSSGGNRLITSGGAAQLDVANGGSFRSFTPAYATAAGTYWISFVSQIPNGSSYAGLSLFNSSNQEMLFLGDPSGGTTWGMETHGVNAGRLTSGLGVNTLAYIVARVDFNVSGDTDNVRLWINPALDAQPLDSAATAADLDVSLNGSGNAMTFDRIRLQQGTSGDNAIFDEIRIGTTWADVSPYEASPIAVPEPGTPALFILGALLYRGLRLRREHRAIQTRR